MKHLSKYCSLHETVNFYISEANLTDAHYLRLWHLGHRGLEEIGMDVTESPRTRLLTVEANKTVKLPEDYMQWCKVGVPNANGEVATLRYNHNLTGYANTNDDRLSLNTDSGESDVVSSDYRNYQENGQFCNLFGVPAGTQYLGEFKVDDVNGIIMLDNQFNGSQIVLEYISSPVSDGEYLFPVQAREAVIAYLRWRNIQSLPAGRRSNNGLIAMHKAEYYNQKRLARQRLNPIRLSDINDVIRLNSRIGIKA